MSHPISATVSVQPCHGLEAIQRELVNTQLYKGTQFHIAVCMQARFDARQGKQHQWEPLYVFHTSSPLMNRTMPGYVGLCPPPHLAEKLRVTRCVNDDYTFAEVRVPCLDAKQVCLFWAYIAFMSRYTSASCLHDVLAAVCTSDCNSSTAVACT